jgi:transposase InsO family protein
MKSTYLLPSQELKRLQFIQNRHFYFFKTKPIKLLSKHKRWRKQAKILKLSKQARTRLEWFIYYEGRAKGNASLTCRHFGISGKTFCKWKKIFDGKNLRLLESRSRAPKNRRKKEITPEQERRVVALRKKHIKWGKIKLVVLYRKQYKEEISSWKIQYTIQKHNLYHNPVKNKKLQNKRKRNQSKKRITELKKKPFPGFLIALDTVVIYCNGAKRYILTAIDTVSKIAFARMYTRKSSRNASDFLKRLFYLLDGSFLNALHDNGSEFHKEFIRACETLNISQYWARPKTPQDNGVNERFNRTLQEEFVGLGNFTSDTVRFNQRLTEWLVEYSFVRPHQALGYLTPWEFYEKTAKVLPMWSSRTNI